MTLPQRLFVGEFGDFELKRLKVFRCVVECGGFALAEAELGTSTSAISKQLSDLEARLGVRLCERGRSGFALTKEGKIVYEASKGLFLAFEDFRSKINSFQSTISGDLYLGLIDAIVTSRQSLLQETLKSFTSMHPRVNLKIISGSAVEIDRLVQDRRLHVGVTLERPGQKDIEACRLFAEENALYCGKDHPLFAMADEDLKPEALKEHKFVRHGYAQADLEAVQQFQFSETSLSNSTEGVLFLIRTGNYLGYLPTHFAQQWEDSGEIRALIPTMANKKTGVCVIVNKQTADTPMIRAFLDFLSGEAST
ncbi:MAG: LysR family transcriptional regulator [Pseudomonadota bacterium]